jgi:membrane protein implicated in regulation of membrane protease activity
MESIVDFFTPLEAWHWLAMGLILIGIEMAIGTFDLLFIGIAALLTALLKLVIPGMGWEAQMAIFAAAAVTLVILGRTVFANIRRVDNKRPMLNDRMARMIGSRGMVVGDFAAGTGRVKIGDTEWLAHGLGGADLKDGTTVLVDSVDTTSVTVKPA